MEKEKGSEREKRGKRVGGKTCEREGKRGREREREIGEMERHGGRERERERERGREHASL